MESISRKNPDFHRMSSDEVENRISQETVGISVLLKEGRKEEGGRNYIIYLDIKNIITGIKNSIDSPLPFPLS